MRFSLSLGASSTTALRASLVDAGVRTNAYADQLWPHVTVARAPRAVVVDVRTIAAHGHNEGATLDVLIAGARAEGFEVCSLETALLLRLAWRDQPSGPRVTVVSPRPVDDEAHPRGFYLRSDDEGLWLRAFVASDDWVFEGTEHVALIAPT